MIKGKSESVAKKETSLIPAELVSRLKELMGPEASTPETAAFVLQTARIESRCPESNQLIFLTVTPSVGITYVEPLSAVVSVVLPRAEDVYDPCIEDARTLQRDRYDSDVFTVLGKNSSVKLFGADGAFCSRVFFFRSFKDAQTWLAVKQGLMVLNVKDAYDVAIEVWVNPLLRQVSRFQP